MNIKAKSAFQTYFWYKYLLSMSCFMLIIRCLLCLMKWNKHIHTYRFLCFKVITYINTLSNHYLYCLNKFALDILKLVLIKLKSKFYMTTNSVYQNFYIKESSKLYIANMAKTNIYGRRFCMRFHGFRLTQLFRMAEEGGVAEGCVELNIISPDSAIDDLRSAIICPRSLVHFYTGSGYLQLDENSIRLYLINNGLQVFCTA